MSRKRKKVVKMKKRNSYVLGTLLCLLAIYLLVIFIQSLTKEHVSIYEVSQKQIADNENLRGLILREEELVNAKNSGYINYYVAEGTKLSTTTTVYSTDEENSTYETASMVDTSDITLSEEDTESIRNDISNFRNHFSLSDYGNILNFRYNIENTMLELSDISLAENLKKIRKENGSSATFQLVKAKKTGIIAFCTDGMESLTLDAITPKHFQEMSDQWKQLRTSEPVEAGEPIYRIVTSEQWSVVVSLNREQYAKLLEKDSVLVRIKKDNISMVPTVRTFISGGNYYASLIFDKYMIHYLNNRYLDIEIQFNNADGLKIPVSSIIKRKCYILPADYLTRGSGTSSAQGVVKISYDDTGQEQTDFVQASIYYRDNENNVYIDAELFPPGTVIQIGTDTSTRLQVTQTGEIDGVYNCNNGYCQFQYINKLYENAEYAIVEKDNAYSLSNYDHIVLNPGLLQKNDIIY